MEDIQDKNNLDNAVNDNESSQIQKKLKKKTKKKEKKNYKDLKDLLDNIKKSKEKKSKTVKKKVKKKKDKKEEIKSEINNQPTEKIISESNNIVIVEDEKNKINENMENKTNNETPKINYIKKLSSTTSSSISHEDLNNEVQNTEETPMKILIMKFKIQKKLQKIDF